MAGGVWDPTDADLGTFLENVTINKSITYTETDEFDVDTTYTVTITPQQTDPSTLTTTDGDPATISGYYFDSFDNELKYLKTDKTYETLEKFENIDTDALDEMIYYLADTTFEKTFSYLAEANGESKTYTITIQNDWTNGKNNLQTYVGYTV